MIRVAVIGGGAAGFMAAVSAVETSSTKISVEIFEKAEPLEKLLATGGGRCNITNATFDLKKLASNYPRGEKFLYSVFSRFAVPETVNWFKLHGVDLYTQDDGRMFPRSDDANTVRDMFLNRASELGIRVKHRSPVSKIERKQDKFAVYVNDESLLFDKVIIAAGGNYRNIENSGYKLAMDLGHKVTELKPALTAFVIKETNFTSLSGVAVKDVEVSAVFKDKLVVRERGDVLFTHKGVSGPAVFRISSCCAFLDYNASQPLVLKINFVPDKTVQDLEKDLLKNFEEFSKKSIGNILSNYAPKSVIALLLQIESIDYEKKPDQITRDERKKIIKLLSEVTLSAKSPMPEGEIVTAGGVELDGVNSKTMESKIIKNLYFCGEVLNIDGFTGGFNLQAAWSTGYIAGLNAAMK